MKEWVVDMLGPRGQRIETTVLAEGLVDDIIFPDRSTVMPQRLEWVVSRIIHDVPYWHQFQVRNVVTGEIIPGEMFGL